MADVETELQAAIYTALTSDECQRAIGEPVPVYDRVPPAALPPYFKIGDTQQIGDTASGTRTTATIGLWAPGPGKALLKAMAGAARTALAPLQDPRAPDEAAPFVLASHQLVTWLFESAQFLDDLDGMSVKGVLTVTYETFPTA